jgi:hypothetical protein
MSVQEQRAFRRNEQVRLTCSELHVLVKMVVTTRPGPKRWAWMTQVKKVIKGVKASDFDIVVWELKKELYGLCADGRLDKGEIDAWIATFVAPELAWSRSVRNRLPAEG